MCGICGWVGAPDRLISRDAVVRMHETIRHRGPDGGGEWLGTSADGRMAAAIGHRRLRIIDLTEAAAQPMTSDDDRIVVSYNGEIYNFRELREELRSRGARFTSTGDTEVVLRAYEEWGEDAFARLDGMFAVAIWDGRSGRLILARDRTGKKPLFYWSDGRDLAFGSEIKAILAAPGVPRTVDDSRIAEFLTFGYVPNPATLHTGISQVPPASIVTVTADGVHPPRRYWSVLEHRSPRAEHGDLHADVRRLLEEATLRRMVADVPLGALLSGGIDSSLVVALMQRHASEPVHTFAIGFSDDASFDERSYARQVADHLGTRHTEFAVELDAVKLMDRLLWHHDQPYMDSSAIPTFVVCEMARRHVTVALNGDGGDEVFGGYDRFRAAALSVRLPSPVVAGISRGVSMLPADHSYYSPRRRVLRFLEQADRPVADRYQSWIAVAGQGLLAQIARPEILSAAAGPVLESMDRRYAEVASLPALDRILYANFMTYLPDDLAVKMDRMSMAHSLETRSPFLDTALMQRLAAVPARQKVGLRRLKPILRKAFWDVLPEPIWNRRKHGFGVPMGTWFRGELGTMFEDEVLADDARSSAYLQPAALGRLYREHRAEEAEHGFRLWTILTLEHWLRTLERPLVLEPPQSVRDATIAAR
jgi:asparagine synthase (glutamine-hydrolysing)